MRIEQLQHLLAIAKWRSMSQAAQQLYLNPSTLSTSVKNLEDELGFSIFARTPQGVSVTLLGQDSISTTLLTSLLKLSLPAYAIS